MCRHRGNKLVWNDFPGEEVSGTCRQFTCKYHAWRYGLDGDLTFVQQEDEFFDLDKADYGLEPVRCEVWEGFIFVNLDPDAEPLAEYLGDFAKGLEGYPFHEMTEVYTYRPRSAATGSCSSTRSPSSTTPRPAPEAGGQGRGRQAGQLRLRSAALRDQGRPLDDLLVGRHGAAEGPVMVKPIERVLRSGLFGPWDRPDIEGSCPTRCRRASTRPATSPGAPTPSSSSPTSCCCSGRRAGT